ncbi:MAG: ABC transporter permease [Acidimicrobiia bacterium]
MGAVGLRVRAGLRTRWQAWLVVALLAGIGGGIVIGAIEGAARAERAYPTFVDENKAIDVLVPGRSDFGLIGAVDLNDVVRLPQVASVADASAALLFTGRTEDGKLIGPGDLFPVASRSNALGSTMETWKMTAGRPARPFEPQEATASFLLARQLDLKVGSTIRLHFFSASSFSSIAGQLIGGFGPRLGSGTAANAADLERLANGPDLTFTITGIEASPSEFPPLPADIRAPLHLTPAFWNLYIDDLVQSPLAYVRLRRGSADLPAFTRAVERLGGDEAVSFVTTRPNQLARVQREIRLEAAALRIFAVVTLAAFGVVVLQALARQFRAEAADDAALRAMGLSTGQFVAVGMVPAAVAGMLAAAIAAGIAIVVSPFAVVGLARIAELDRGITVDPVVIGLGALAVLVVVPLLALGPALLRARAAQRVRPTDQRSPRPLRLIERFRVRPSTAVGVHFAVDPGRGTSSVPIRSTIVGFTLTVALLTGVLGFSASLGHLLGTERLYGWTWDLKTGAPALPDLAAVLVPALRDDPRVEEFSTGTATQVLLDGQRVEALALEQVRGTVAPLVTSGHLPRRAGEILLGARTMRALGVERGDTVTAQIGSSSADLRVVGTGVFPGIGDGGEFGSGSLVTYQTLERLFPDVRRNVYLIRFAPGVAKESAFSQVKAALQPLPSVRAERPNDLQNLARLDGLQAVLVIILTTLAGATLANTLVTSTRQRRRELAVLKALGFTHRQVASTVIWQALTLAAIGVAIGLVLGTLGARWAWTFFAANLGILNISVFPTLPVVVLIPIALLAALLVALIPATAAGRTRPSTVLHAE